MNRLTTMFRLFASRLRQQIVVGYLLFIAPLSLQAQPVLTLEKAIQEVLQNNKTLQQARNHRKIAAHDNHIVKTDFFPTLTLPSISATWPGSEGPHRQFGVGSLHRGAVKSLSEHTWWRNEIGLGWKLSPSSLFSYQTFRVRDQISELEWQQKVATQIAETTKAYYSLVLAQKKQKMGVQSLSIAQETLQLAKAKHDVGQATALDYLDAQVTYEQAQATFEHQEEQITKQKRALSKRLGRGQFEAFEVVEAIPLPESLDWEKLLAAYKANSPVLRLAKKQHQYHLNMLKLKQTDQLFPSFGVDLTYTCWEKKPQYRIGFTLDFTNIFQYAINVRKERLEAENHRLALADTQIDEEEKLQQQFLVYTHRLQDYALQQRIVQVSQARAAEALEKYRLGSITLLDLKREQEKAQKATQQRLSMCYEVKAKEVELRAMAGMPLVNDGL